MSTLRPARCLYKHSTLVIKQTARLAGVAVRHAHSAGEDGEPGRDRRARTRYIFGAGSLGLALLAADHVFNGS